MDTEIGNRHHSSGELRATRVRCDGCGRTWLACGLRPGDAYVCRECGRQFVIDEEAEQFSPSSSPALKRKAD